MMDTVLWKHSNSLLWLHSEVQESHLTLPLRALRTGSMYTVFQSRLPKLRKVITWFCSVFFCLFVNKNREMSDCLHCFLIYLRPISTYKKAWKSFIQIADCTLFSANINNLSAKQKIKLDIKLSILPFCFSSTK